MDLSSEICSSWLVISRTITRHFHVEQNSSFVENVVLVVYLVNTRFNTFSFYSFRKHPALHSGTLPTCVTLASTPDHSAGKDQAAAPKNQTRVKEQWDRSLPLLKAAGAALETALTSRCHSGVTVCALKCLLSQSGKQRIAQNYTKQCEKFKFFSFKGTA